MVGQVVRGVGTPRTIRPRWDRGRGGERRAEMALEDAADQGRRPGGPAWPEGAGQASAGAGCRPPRAALVPIGTPLAVRGIREGPGAPEEVGGRKGAGVVARILAVPFGVITPASEPRLQRLRDLERNNPMQVPSEGGLCNAAEEMRAGL